MKRILLIALIAMGVSPVLSAQNSQSGYIITLSGDTIRGVIAELPNSYHREVAFKKASADSYTQYFPESLRGFTVNDKVFHSKMVTGEEKEENLFLTVSIQGKINLYYINRSNEASRFFVEKYEKVQELPQARVKQSGSGVTSYVENRKFVTALDKLTLDCSNMTDRLNATSFTLESLSGLIQGYNLACGGNYKGPTYETRGFDRSRKVKLEFFGGLNFISMKNENLSFFQDPDKATGIHLGAKVYGRFPRMPKDLYLILGLSYNEKGVENKDRLAKVDLKHFSISPGLSYQFLKKGAYSLNFSFNGIISSIFNREEAFTRFSSVGMPINFFPSFLLAPEFELGYAFGLDLHKELNEKTSLKFGVSYEDTTLEGNNIATKFESNVLQLSFGIIFH